MVLKLTPCPADDSTFRKMGGVILIPAQYKEAAKHGNYFKYLLSFLHHRKMNVYNTNSWELLVKNVSSFVELREKQESPKSR